MKTCKQASAEWGISIRSVNALCNRGRIPGAEKVGGTWQIPDDAKKPIDGRISSGKYAKKNVLIILLQMKKNYLKQNL